MTTTPFTESEELVALRESVFKLASSYGREYVLEKARSGGKITELWNDMGKHGFLGVNLPEEYGGGGGGISELAAVLEESAAAGCPLLMMVVFTVVFSQLFQSKVAWFPVFILVALLPWNYVATVVSRSTTSVTQNASLLNKVAFPAEYGSSGVMTFIMNHDGVIYEKDLGPKTAEVAQKITVFNPDETWKRQ